MLFSGQSGGGVPDLRGMEKILPIVKYAYFGNWERCWELRNVSKFFEIILSIHYTLTPRPAGYWRAWAAHRSPSSWRRWGARRPPRRRCPARWARPGWGGCLWSRRCRRCWTRTPRRAGESSESLRNFWSAALPFRCWMTWKWRIKELAFLFFGKSFSPLGSLDLLELLVAIGWADR